jgi:hypothetical protein
MEKFYGAVTITVNEIHLLKEWYRHRIFRIGLASVNLDDFSTEKSWSVQFSYGFQQYSCAAEVFALQRDS